MDNVQLYSEYKPRDAAWISTAQKLHEARQMKRHFDAIEKNLMEELRDLSQGDSSKGGGFLFECTERKGSVDYKTIPYLMTIDLDRYRKPGVIIWKLTKI